MKISKIIEKNKKAIILIDTRIPEGNNRTKISIRGTGFMVSDDGKFITNLHVYRKVLSNELQYLGAFVMSNTDEKGITHYNRHRIELLKEDKENDLALMKIITNNDEKFEPIAKFGNSESVKEGDEVIFIGYPLATDLLRLGFGLTMSTNKCIISSVKKRGADGSLHFFMVDTHINKGSSGSPVFFIDTGKIIGIASGKISQMINTPDGKKLDIPANMGICRPSKYINNLIEK